jgi:hypothetical protein
MYLIRAVGKALAHEVDFVKSGGETLLEFSQRQFRLLRKSRHGHLQNQTRGSRLRLGSLYYVREIVF